MIKSKVAITIVAIVAASALAYQELKGEFTTQAPSEQSTNAQPKAPVSKAAPVNSDNLSLSQSQPSVKASQQLANQTVVNPKSPKPISELTVAPATTRSISQSSLTARHKASSAKDSLGSIQARPHGHEDHNINHHVRRPPGEPKKPVPNQTIAN